MTGEPLRILWVATKAPWPPRDGGRLLLGLTLGALAERGAAIELVAPTDPRRDDGAAIERELGSQCRCHLVPLRPRSPFAAALTSALGTAPFTIARHARREVEEAVARAIAERRPDVVVAEQLQALAQTAPARQAGCPVVLRAQNVESELWTALAAQRRGPLAIALRREAGRLARWEGQALAAARRVVALSGRDASRLRGLSGGRAHVEVVPPPFPAELPAGAPLAGEPAFVLFGSEGWAPNRDAVRWFLGEAWPELARRLPGARLHRFGGDAVQVPGTFTHPAPEESGVAFGAGSILVLPLRIASGVRMRALEAWARGVPIVGTAAAVAGLSGEDGVEWLSAPEGAGLVAAAVRLAGDRELVATLAAGGRARLRRDHDPGAVAGTLLELLRGAARGTR